MHSGDISELNGVIQILFLKTQYKYIDGFGKIYEKYCRAVGLCSLIGYVTILVYW